jgi:hypothetical protein
MMGHVWNEVGDDLVDFSCGDWKHEAEMLVTLYPDGLPPVVWHVTPPPYLWQAAAPVKASWRSVGSPALGEFWYGQWASATYPDQGAASFALQVALNQIDYNIERYGLRDRVAQ